MAEYEKPSYFDAVVDRVKDMMPRSPKKAIKDSKAGARFANRGAQLDALEAEAMGRMHDRQHTDNSNR